MAGSYKESVGAAIGGTLGLIKSYLLFSMVSWEVLVDTMILSAAGALVGFLVTSLLKYLKSKFKKS